MEKKRSEKGLWSASVFVNCPYCGELQDLFDEDNGEPRLPLDLEIGENGTDRVKDLEVCCLDCGEEFIVPDFEW